MNETVKGRKDRIGYATSTYVKCENCAHFMSDFVTKHDNWRGDYTVRINQRCQKHRMKVGLTSVCREWEHPNKKAGLRLVCQSTQEGIHNDS